MLLNTYSFMNCIGKGAYGTIILAVDKSRNRNVAIKQISAINENVIASKRAIREVFMLHSLRHDNILSLLDVGVSESKLYAVTSCCETDLHRAMYGNEEIKLKVSDYARISYQMLDAVSYMHSMGVIHRDIKPKNILINSDLSVKICDFGYARWTGNEDAVGQANSEPLTEYMVTRWYRAPEVLLLPGRYGTAQDVWSIACVIGELIRRAPLFAGKTTLNQVQTVVETLGKLSDQDLNFEMPGNSLKFLNRIRVNENIGLLGVIPNVIEMHRDMYKLMLDMLQFNPHLRITAADAMKSNVFNDIKQFNNINLTSIKWNKYQEAMITIDSNESNESSEERLNIVTKFVEYINEEIITDQNKTFSIDIALSPGRNGYRKNSKDLVISPGRNVYGKNGKSLKDIAPSPGRSGYAKSMNGSVCGSVKESHSNSVRGSLQNSRVSGFSGRSLVTDGKRSQAPSQKIERSKRSSVARSETYSARNMQVASKPTPSFLTSRRKRFSISSKIFSILKFAFIWPVCGRRRKYRVGSTKSNAIPNNDETTMRRKVKKSIRMKPSSVRIANSERSVTRRSVRKRSNASVAVEEYINAPDIAIAMITRTSSTSSLGDTPVGLSGTDNPPRQSSLTTDQLERVEEDVELELPKPIYSTRINPSNPYRGRGSEAGSVRSNAHSVRSNVQSVRSHAQSMT